MPWLRKTPPGRSRRQARSKYSGSRDSPDVLEHPYAHQLIETAPLFDLPIIAHLGPAALGQSRRPDSFVGQFGLGSTERDSHTLGAVFAGGVQDQPPQPQPRSSSRSPGRRRSLRQM